MADPLKIGVEVDVSQLAKLAEASQSVAVNIQSMATQFMQGTVSAKQLATTFSGASESIASSIPGLTAMTTRLLNLRDVQQSLQKEVKETAAFIAEEGGEANVQSSVYEHYADVKIQAAVATQVLATAEKEYSQTLNSGFAAQQAAIVQQQAAAQAAARAATEKAAAAAMAAEAADVEAAANEGMVASDLQWVEQENLGALATEKKAVALDYSSAAMRGNSLSLFGNTEAVKTNTGSQELNLKTLNASATGHARLAQQFLASGMSARQAADAMRANGLSAEQVSTTFAALGITLPEVTRQMTALESAMATGTTRIAAADLGLGQLGFSVSRIVAKVPSLGIVLAAAFPVIAIVTFIQILDQAANKLDEWSKQAEKAADASAKFDRELQHSAESANRARESLLGQIEPLAGLAQKMADASNKSVDLTGDMEALNKKVETLPTGWTRFTTDVGHAWISMTGIFRSSSSEATREAEVFTHKLQDEVKTVKDLPGGIADVTLEIARLKTAYDNYTPSILISAADAQVQKAALKALVDTFMELRNAMEQQKGAAESSAQKDQIEQQQKVMSAQIAASQAYVSLEETEAKALTTIHAASTDEQLKELQRLETARRDLSLKELSQQEATLRREHALDASFDPTSAIAVIEAKKTAVRDESTKRMLDMNLAAYTKDNQAAEQSATAQIESAAKVAEANLRLQEVKSRETLSRADTGGGVENAANARIRESNELYQIQINALHQVAAAKLASLEPTAGAKPTADLGTDAFAKQLEAIKERAPAVYAELVKMNADEIVLRSQGAAAAEEIENQKQNKIRQIRAEEVNNQISGLNNSLIGERELYQDASIALQVSLSKNRGGYSSYYSDIKSLAQDNYEHQVSLLAQEETIARASVDAGTKTAQEGARLLNEIDKREEEAHKQMMAREVEAAKKAVEKEQEEIKQVTNKIAADFVQMANKILTTHQSIGKDAMQLGRELELYIIDQGIKTVVSKYAAQLLQMVAAHSEFLASILHITVAGSAAEEAVNTAEAMGKISASAATSGAAGFASVMASLPFPANVAAAPGVASAAAGATEGYASLLAFEKGGVVPANLHAGEMVLPQHISNFVQNAAASAAAPEKGGGGSSTTHVNNHHHYNIRIDGATSKGDIQDMVHAAVIPAIKKAHRFGMLPTQGH